MAVTFDLLALPNELICIVLDQTPPSDFERLMLSCKRVYDSGKPTLAAHKEAKTAMSYTDTRVAGSPSNRLYMPLDILARIAKMSDIDRRRAVALVHGLQYFYRSTEWRSGDSFAWLVDILEHMPELLKEFVGIVAQLRKPDDSSNAKHTAPLDELRRLESAGLIKNVQGNGFFWPGNRPSGEGVGASQAHWDVAAIFLMEGLRRLTINETVRHVLADSLNGAKGDRWLQELRDLRIEGPPSTLCWNITAWLCLPKLISLVVDELRINWQCDDPGVYPNSFVWQRRHSLRAQIEKQHLTTIFDENRPLTPVLEHLVIRRTTLHPKELVPIIQRLPNLRTFAWCVTQDTERDNRAHVLIPLDSSQTFIMPKDEDEDIHARTHDPKSPDYPEERASDYIIFSNGLYLTADVLADRSAEERRNTFYTLDLSEVPTLAGTKRSPFPLYTQTLVNALREREYTATNRLEHLILTVHDDGKTNFILSQHCVPHFKDFTHLTHLEIDDRLLSREIIVVWEDMVDIQLRCLVDYLPPSIVYVRLHLSNDFTDCRHLFDNIAKRRDEVPNLRLIAVRDLTMVHNRQVLYQAEQDLKVVGVKLLVETLHTDPAWVERRTCFERIDGSRGIDTTFFQL